MNKQKINNNYTKAAKIIANNKLYITIINLLLYIPDIILTTISLT